MFRQDTAEEKEFRENFRGWLDINLTADLRGWSTRPPIDLAMVWYRRLSEGGYIAPHWPKKYGGMGATLNQQIIIREELAAASAPEITMQGTNHIGPILMQYGTDAQREQHLSHILTGDVLWCQGYSEPGSGSDLASLTTRAEVHDDHFLVSGHKIWTTWAHHCHWMFLLVRSDVEATPKQAGISFIMLDMATPGVDAQPIYTLAGDDEFAQVFLDNVKVPRENLIGELHGGWKVANSLLGHERLASSNPTACFDGLDRVKRVAMATGADRSKAFRDRLASVELEVLSMSALFSHGVSLSNAEQPMGPDSSIMKIWGSETLQRVADLLLEAAGGSASDLAKISTPEGDVDAGGFYRQVRRSTIYGGANEVQRNIISKRVLSLPV